MRPRKFRWVEVALAAVVAKLKVPLLVLGNGSKGRKATASLLRAALGMTLPTIPIFSGSFRMMGRRVRASTKPRKSPLRIASVGTMRKALEAPVAAYPDSQLKKKNVLSVPL